MAIKSTKAEQKNVLRSEREETVAIESQSTKRGVIYESSEKPERVSKGLCKKIKFKWVC